jgi:hypothetical protein
MEKEIDVEEFQTDPCGVEAVYPESTKRGGVPDGLLWA